MKQCRLGLILVLFLFFALSACKGTDIENAAQTQTFFETERDRKLQETSKARWEDIDEDGDASLEDSREESDMPPSSEEEAAITDADGSGRDCPTSEQAFELLREKESVRYYLELGMAMLDTDQQETVNGQSCRIISLGSDQEAHFVQEFQYAVSYSGIYVYDVISDEWLELED